MICGILQGSTLGPLLFLIYVNDVVKAIKHAKILLYADDTVIYLSGKDKHEVNRLLQEDLITYNVWFQRNRLTVNCKKTKFMCFGLSFRWKNCKFKIGNIDIFGVLSYKYLGVILDQALNYDKFLKLRTANFRTYQLTRMSQFSHRYINL